VGIGPFSQFCLLSVVTYLTEQNVIRINNSFIKQAIIKKVSYLNILALQPPCNIQAFPQAPHPSATIWIHHLTCLSCFKTFKSRI